MENTTEILLQKARERRARGPNKALGAAALLSRERTGAEIISSIASGVNSPPFSRRIIDKITSPNIRRANVRGTAGGVKGARPIVAVAEVKSVPLGEVVDDFELLQEQMKSRFRKNDESDTKENLKSPLFSPTNKKSFFASLDLSPVMSPVMSPNKKYFPPVDLQNQEEPKTTVPVKTVSDPKISKPDLKNMSYRSPEKNSQSPTRQPLSPTKILSSQSLKYVSSPNRQISPIKPLSSASFKKFGAPVSRSPEPPVRSVSLRQKCTVELTSPQKDCFEKEVKPMVLQKPKLTAKPNSVVSRALARLEHKKDENMEEVEGDEEPLEEVEGPVDGDEKPGEDELMEEEQANFVDKSDSVVLENPESVICPGSPVVEPDSFMVLCNAVMCDISTLKKGTKGKAMDTLPETERSQGEESQIRPVQPTVRELKLESSPYKLGHTPDKLWNTPDKLGNTPDKLGNTEEKLEKSPDTAYTSDLSDEWLSFDSPASSHKREASCLADSVFGSMGDISKPTSSSEDMTSPIRALSPTRGPRQALSPSHGPRQALSPSRAQSPKRPPTKKLRRSMSVSDISASPSKFVRLESLRSSNKALQRERRKSSRLSERVSTSQRRRKPGKGPLVEGTLDQRPPFDQIKVLEEGVMIQTQLESQAAQLLDHCNSGLEQVDTEKLLLLAGLKKELWQHHLSEMKNDKFAYKKDEKGRGSLIVKDISLLLRQDYLVNKVVDMKTSQSFFAVIKIAPYRIVATTTATSQSNINGSNLIFTDVIHIENLPPDFTLTIEIYNMQYNAAAQPTTPNGRKKKVEATKSNTPKRLLQTALSKMSQKNKLEKTSNFSSSMDNFKQWGSKTSSKRGGSFVLAGTLILRIKDVASTSFRLRRAPFHSPFEGTISLNMSVKEAVGNENPTLKGFLTIFQEESGLGAWNRRWCSVQDNKIYYWLYPEDEVNRNKEPHGDIDIRDCKTSKISVASRLDCARPNTFVLVTETPTKPGDRTSIICEAVNDRTVTKYLLSADSKEERREWMRVLNQCLENVISWNTK